jgi:hypothetical protein
MPLTPTQSQLAQDADFEARVSATVLQQADALSHDARPAVVALAKKILGEEPAVWNLTCLAAAGPGSEGVDNGDGTIDQAKMSDSDILASVLANWSVVAGLYYNADGTPL